MGEQVKQIALRIADLRDIAGDTISDVAKALGMEASLLAEYEKGEIDIPVSFLLAFAALYKIDLTTLLTGENPRMHKYCLNRAGKGVSVLRHKQYDYRNLAYNFINKKAEPFYVTILPGSNPDLVTNVHEGQEYSYVLKGTLRMFISNEELILKPGDSVYFDSNCPHSAQAVGDQNAEFITLILP